MIFIGSRLIKLVCSCQDYCSTGIDNNRHVLSSGHTGHWSLAEHDDTHARTHTRTHTHARARAQTNTYTRARAPTAGSDMYEDFRPLLKLFHHSTGNPTWPMPQNDNEYISKYSNMCDIEILICGRYMYFHMQSTCDIDKSHKRQCKSPCNLVPLVMPCTIQLDRVPVLMCQT